MAEEHKKPAEEVENFNTVGCGFLTLLGGVGILWLMWESYAPGYRPIGTAVSTIFGGGLVLLGSYRIIRGIIAKWQDRR